MIIDSGLVALRIQRICNSGIRPKASFFQPRCFSQPNNELMHRWHVHSEAPRTQNASIYLAKHDSTRFQARSRNHYATIYVHHKDFDLSTYSTFPTFLDSIPRYMPASLNLFSMGWRILNDLHRCYPHADSSFIKVSERWQAPGTYATALEVKLCKFSQKRERCRVVSRSHSYCNGPLITSDDRRLSVIIEAKETGLQMKQEKTGHWQVLDKLLNLIDQKSMANAFETSYRKLDHMVNEELAPLDQCLRRLAVLFFEIVDQISPQNKVKEVLVAVKDEKDYERTRYTLDRKAVQRLASNCSSSSEETGTKVYSHTAFIALGSNVGDRIATIEAACAMMKNEDLQIQRTSAIYESLPMYYEEQNQFINGVCKIKTALSPRELLTKLQGIEERLGRVKSVENGPRNIDLDILLYDDVTISLPDLVIPHKRMLDRAFVIRPLCDIAAKEWTWGTDSLVKPSFVSKPNFQEILPLLLDQQGPLFPITPLSSAHSELVSESPIRKTHLMAILNLTPDSFSDGGVHEPAPSALLDTLRTFVQDGATIIDVGGQSSRPGAVEVSAEEEAARVLPAIELIRSHSEFDEIIISIDTYRASVAKAAIKAGAHVVNDVSAGLMDPEMLSTVARLGCTVILGHMRGTPLTMSKRTNYEPSVIHTVEKELQERFDAAELAGIYRWRIILDPGIGFAKNQQQNLEILKDLENLRATGGLKGLPLCVGSSRKGFIGKITGVDVPKDRVIGSAICVAAAIQGGAEIVRVHDVKETAEAIKTADAIWRVEEKQKLPSPKELGKEPIVSQKPQGGPSSRDLGEPQEPRRQQESPEPQELQEQTDHRDRTERYKSLELRKLEKG